MSWSLQKVESCQGNRPLGVRLEVSELGHFLPTFYYVTINAFVQLSHIPATMPVLHGWAVGSQTVTQCFFPLVTASF